MFGSQKYNEAKMHHVKDLSSEIFVRDQKTALLASAIRIQQVKSPQPFQLPYLERLSESKDQKSQNIIPAINFHRNEASNFKNEAVRLSLNGSVEVIRAKKVSGNLPV